MLALNPHSVLPQNVLDLSYILTVTLNFLRFLPFIFNYFATVIRFFLTILYYNHSLISSLQCFCLGILYLLRTDSMLKDWRGQFLNGCYLV